MTYLRIRNFWNYQNADVWKKAKANKVGHRHPAWCKLYVHRDLKLDSQAPIVRLVFYELLRLATVCGNVIPNDVSTIANAISTPRHEVAKAIPILLKGAWLSETKSGRPSRELLDQIQIEKQKKRTVSKSSSNGNYRLDERALDKLLQSIKDRDEGTEFVIRGIAVKYHLAEGDLMVARDAAMSDSARSPAAVAVAELKRLGVERTGRNVRPPR